MEGVRAGLSVLRRLAAGRRSVAGLLAGLVCLLLFYGLYRPVAAPALGASLPGPGHAATITAVTYNIRHGADSAGGIALDQVAQELDQTGADLIGLQEVDRYLPRSGLADQAAVLARRLGMHYRFEANLGLGPVGYGNALLSRFPIREWRKVSLPGPGEPRGAIVARVDLAGRGQMGVVVTHLGLGREARARQVRSLLAAVTGKDYMSRVDDMPLVVLGDWNSTPSSAAVRLMQTRLRDSAGPGPGEATFPGLGRIDYVFVSPDIKVLAASPLRGGPSDHYPFSTKLLLPALPAPRFGVYPPAIWPS